MQSRYNLYLEQFFKLPRKYASRSREGLVCILAAFWEFEREIAIPAFLRFVRSLVSAF